MKKHVAFIALALVCSLAYAQESQEFSKIEIKSGEAEINLQTGKFEEFTKGVKVTLSAEDDTVAPIIITGDSMEIMTEGDSSTIAGFIINKGKAKNDKVDLDHPQTKITADKPQWNSSAGTLDFTGNVIADIGYESPAQAQTLKYDLATGRITGTGVSVGLSIEN